MRFVVWLILFIIITRLEKPQNSTVSSHFFGTAECCGLIINPVSHQEYPAHQGFAGPRQDRHPSARPLPQNQEPPAQSTRPPRTRTGRYSPSGHPLASSRSSTPFAIRLGFLRQYGHRLPGFSPSLAVILDVAPGSASSFLSHRRWTAPARHKDARLTSCRSHRGPTAHHAGSPCPGSRGRVSFPYEHRAGQLQSSDEMSVSVAGLPSHRRAMGAVLDVMLDGPEVDQFSPGSMRSGQSALVSSYQCHSKRKCKLSW